MSSGVRVPLPAWVSCCMGGGRASVLIFGITARRASVLSCVGGDRSILFRRQRTLHTHISAWTLCFAGSFAEVPCSALRSFFEFFLFGPSERRLLLQTNTNQATHRPVCACGDRVSALPYARVENRVDQTAHVVAASRQVASSVAAWQYAIQTRGR